MEMVLALAVMIAVIIFGALISVGNERQKSAIDGLREQIVLWALHDLRIKREKLAREAHVEDPLQWLNHFIARVVGENLQLEISEVFSEPEALVCHTVDGRRAILTPLSPVTLQKMTRQRRSRLSQTWVDNHLLFIHRNFVIYEISVLNGGMLFDLELPLAWKALTGQNANQTGRLWLYVSR